MTDLAIDGARIGIDIGGTKIAAALFAADGHTVTECRIGTPRNYGATVGALAEIVDGFAAQAGHRPERLGICMPGQITRAGGILSCVNLPWLVDRPLAADLGDRIGMSVGLANDANCFALSEAIDGAGRSADVVFGITLGTGVGGGLVIGRQIVVGANALTGEWGHMRFPFDNVVDPEPTQCGCGRIGCNETVLRGQALVDEFRRNGGEADSAPEVVAISDRNPAAGRVLAAYCDRLARALVDIVHMLDPDVIVVGGGLSRVAPLFELVPPALAGYALGDIARCRFVPAVFGAESGLRGASRL